MPHLWGSPFLNNEGHRKSQCRKAIAGNRVVLAETPPKFAKTSRRGSAVSIPAAKGAGQYRRLASYDGPRIELDRPWQLEPDRNSRLSITMPHGPYLFVDVNGKFAASKNNSIVRASNTEPIVIGREAWGGDPPRSNTPGLFLGCLSKIAIRPRALAAVEIQDDYRDNSPRTCKTGTTHC
jgi:hypothetical protein